MRRTLTLDDDVAAKVKTESQRAGRPFREIVNETLRRGLESPRATAQRRAFKVTARDLGNLKPGLSLDNIAELIEYVKGSLNRRSLSTRTCSSMPTIRGRSSTRKAEPGSKPCSRGPGSRLLAVFRAQMDKPPRGEPLTERKNCQGLAMTAQAKGCELRNLDTRADSD